MMAAQLRHLEDRCAVAAAAFRKLFPLDVDGHRRFREAATALCQTFFAEGLGDADTHTRLHKRQYFWQVFSEMLAANALWSADLKPMHPGSTGPDFLIDHEGQRIWIEVICPEATDSIPPSWFEDGLKHLPHQEILLRWTNAIDSKTKALIGSDRNEGYLKKGIVHHGDAYVIAVNGRLLRGVIPQLEGISQLPFAVEAVFPVGPMSVRVTPIGPPELPAQDFEFSDAFHSERMKIPKTRSDGEIVHVPTTAFLNPAFAAVSAMWALDLGENALSDGRSPMAVVHNPLATNPVPCGLLPAYSEFVAVDNGDYYALSEKKGRLI